MGAGGGKSATVIGYRYYLGMHMGVCRGPIDEIVEIKVGDKFAFPWSEGEWYFDFTTGWNISGPDNPYSPPITDSGVYAIKAGNLFGGDKKEGGITGTFTVMMGHEGQIVPAWIKAKLGGNVPDFRGVVTCYFDGLLTTLNPYPKKWKIRHRRTMSGWDGPVWQPSLSTIWLSGGKIKAMNPAHILYECTTNRDWGRGYSRSRIHEPSWAAAAQTLFDEGFGLCLRWNRRETLNSFIQNVLNHIGGGIYVDRETGLIALRLIRGDYDPDTLPLFDYNSGLVAIERGEIASRDNSPNEIVVRYKDPITDTERETRAQNLASLQSLNGASNNNTIDYTGIPTFDLAARVAQRDLRATTTALRRYKVTLDRRAWRIYPGAVFRISAPDRGIANLVLRAGKVSQSNVGDGKIVVEAVIDVFGLAASSFTEPEPPQWEAPTTLPIVATQRKVREANYRDFYLRLSAADLALVDTLSGGIATMAVKPSAMAQSYAIARKTASEDYVDGGNDGFSAAVVLASSIGPYTTTFAFAASFELGLAQVGSLIQIGEELLVLRDIDVDEDGASGVLTVERGCVDTVPTTHAAGAYAFFLNDPIGTDRREYSSGEVVDVKLLTVTSASTLVPDLAPLNSVAIVARQGRPYPPAFVRVNGTLCHDVTLVSGALTISWRHRDRKIQADQIIPHDAADIGPEAGTTYRIRIYSSGGSLLTTISGILGTFYVLPEEYAGNLRFELESVRDGLASFQNYNFSLTRV